MRSFDSVVPYSLAAHTGSMSQPPTTTGSRTKFVSGKAIVKFFRLVSVDVDGYLIINLSSFRRLIINSPQLRLLMFSQDIVRAAVVQIFEHFRHLVKPLLVMI